MTSVYVSFKRLEIWNVAETDYVKRFHISSSSTTHAFANNPSLPDPNKPLPFPPTCLYDLKMIWFYKFKCLDFNYYNFNYYYNFKYWNLTIIIIIEYFKF